MRVDPVAAMQSLLLGLLKGGSGARSAAPFPAGDRQASPAPVTPATITLPTGSVAMLVAVAAQAPGITRTPALRRAENGLAALGRLHRALACGADPEQQLAQLRQWTEDQRGEDGKLGGLMADIELRILVELAKAEPR